MGASRSQPLARHCRGAVWKQERPMAEGDAERWVPIPQNATERDGCPHPRAMRHSGPYGELCRAGCSPRKPWARPHPGAPQVPSPRTQSLSPLPAQAQCHTHSDKLSPDVPAARVGSTDRAEPLNRAQLLSREPRWGQHPSACTSCLTFPGQAAPPWPPPQEPSGPPTRGAG